MTRSSLSLVTALLLAAGACAAAELIVPAAVERDRPMTAVFRTGAQATGKGELAVRWTDALGRVVEDRRIPVELIDETEIRFALDVRRAVAMRNQVQVRFTFEGVNKRGAADRRDESAAASFVARPPDRTWSDYMIMMWQSHDAQRFAALQSLGINAGQYSGRAQRTPEFLLNNDARWYAENLATDFYAEYHRFRSDRIQNWSYLQAKELYKQDPASKEAFKRKPSFSDPAWLTKIHDRAVEAARVWSPYRPIFYDLADESGIADLAAYWDFDFSDESLVEMRAWLRDRYGTLAALNSQWGSKFDAWERVTPDTTREAMARGDENYSAWADHKEWMDVSFARALKMGVDAVRSVDPDAFVGIAGAQMPGWGGYDYYRLSQALTAFEPYDIGNNIEILRSLNPRIPIVTTSFARGPWEKHRIWYELLHGARGNIIWDEKAEHVGKDGTVGERGREVAPYYREIGGGIGALLIASAREADPVAIHYSQASMRTEWMLAQRPKGEVWVTRNSSTERRDSEFLRLRESYTKLVEDLGLQYNFVAYGQVEQGELARGGYRVLILPCSSALSEAEAAAIREFVRQGGLLIADGEPGVFDEHSRRLAQPRLADLFNGGQGRGKTVRLNALTYLQQRLMGKEGELHGAARELFAGHGVRPGLAEVGVETHKFRNGGVEIIGLLGNPQLRVNELGPPEFKSNERFEKPRTVRLVLDGEREVYDIRAAKSLGRRKELSVALDPYEPALYAVSPTPIPALEVAAPARARRGESAAIGIRFAAASPASAHVLHVEVADPSGKVMPHYSGNLAAPGGVAAKLLPLAANDPPGRWTVRVRDILSGQEQAAAIEVQ
jgi:hypothetical protein